MSDILCRAMRHTSVLQESRQGNLVGGVFNAKESVVGVRGRPAVLHCSDVSPLLAGLVRTRPSLARLIRRSTADDVVLGVDTVRPQSSVQPTVLRLSRLSLWCQRDV